MGSGNSVGKSQVAAASLWWFLWMKSDEDTRKAIERAVNEAWEEYYGDTVEEK